MRFNVLKPSGNFTYHQVFITEVESVYSAVRTESLYKTDTLRL
jgi:hypothetical protein